MSSVFSYSRHETDLRKGEQMKAQALAGCVPIYETSLYMPSGEPLVFVDARHRPDLRDLPRVVRAEALIEGADTRTRWMYLTGKMIADQTAILDLIFTAPVRCKLKIAFSFKKDNDFLWSAAQTGIVRIHIGEPKAFDPQFVTFRTQVQTADLLEVLRWYASVELSQMRQKAN